MTMNFGSFAELLETPQGKDAQVVIATQGDLSALSPAFKRLRVDLVGSTAASKVCPAELENGEIVLFCTTEQRDKDLHRSQQTLLVDSGLVVKGKKPRTFEISPVMLLTLVREGIDGQSLASSPKRGRDASDISRAFRDIVTWCIRQGASDVHLNIDSESADSQIHVHIDGHYIAPESLRLPTPRLMEIANVAWLDVIGGGEPAFDPRTEQQGRLYEVVDGSNYMLRWGSFIADKGPSVTLRILNLDETVDSLTLQSLGYLPSHVEKLERAQRSEGGAIVLGGVVGSGKSTTIARLLSELPLNRKVMTLEDPVERIIRGALQASVVRDLKSTGSNSYRRKLMALKRSAASDILLGEIRDTETGQAFQDIVESGSNLYTTVHVYSMLGIPSRLASRQIGVPTDLLASPGQLKLVGYQALLPLLCDNCALPVSYLSGGMTDSLGHVRSNEYWTKYRERLTRLYQNIEGVRIRNHEGCERCQTKELPDLYGYQGRTVVAELFELGHNLDALRCVRDHDSIGLMQVYQALSDGNQHSEDMDGKTAMDCAVYKMLKGQLDPRDVEPRFMAFETLELRGNGRK